MARDYKKANPKTTKPPTSEKKRAVVSSKPKSTAEGKRGVSPILSMGLGLSIGLAVAVYVYFVSSPALLKEGESETPVIVIEPTSNDTKNRVEVVDDEGARFDFYSILPQLEVVIPEQEAYEQKQGLSGAAPQKIIKPIKSPGRYLLQAGSFRKSTDAERVKAELAFLGIESYIEPVVINGSNTWYRVRVGPFDDNKNLDKARNRLLDNHVEVMILRVKGG